MLVVTMDQKASRSTGDAVPALLRSVSDVCVIAPFERTAGDEVQGVPADAAALYTVVRAAIRAGCWYVGIGGGAGRVGADGGARSGSGAAFVAAREAVDAAKRSRVPLAVRGEDPEAAARAQAVLRLQALLLARRSRLQWEAVDLVESGVSGQQAARRLAVTEQAFSQRRIASGLAEEKEALPVLLALLNTLDRSADPRVSPVPAHVGGT
ncbi:MULTISPECIES: hypothetical protein [Actinomyces]|uniref:hypothetical protein n=1 Tax=Actinomyces TaxID=1654 RepID=UPI001603F846|nr:MULTISPECIES: hypothetical protein [Actinomyces]